MNRPDFHVIHTQGVPIATQLQIEEKLLRHDDRNFCWINEGTSPTIVLGVSGKPDQWIDLKQNFLPVIQRFSGGGTVIVDENTIFITFIMQKTFPAFPENIHAWAIEIYQKAFPQITLCQNDYVIQSRKCGGNAQYIKKNRWLHHTSFLWDYNPTHMQLLLTPPKMPSYRANRSHADFLTPLKDHFPQKTAWIQRFKNELSALFPTQSFNLSCLSNENSGS